jgi:hypothetical protein
MKKLLRWRVTSAAFDERFAWGASFLIITACSVLAAIMLPELGVAVRVGLVLSLAAGWLVMG